MKKIESNSFNIFERMKLAKMKFCAKVIIKLDKIIIKCSSKELVEEVKRKLDEAEDINKFSEKFYQNKDELATYIQNINEDNEYYRRVIIELNQAFNNKNYLLVSKIFEDIGLKNYEQIGE